MLITRDDVGRKVFSVMHGWCRELFTDIWDGCCEYKNKEIKELKENNIKILETIGGMAGNPDAVEGCRLIVKRIRKILDGR